MEAFKSRLSFGSFRSGVFRIRRMRSKASQDFIHFISTEALRRGIWSGGLYNWHETLASCRRTWHSGETDQNMVSKQTYQVKETLFEERPILKYIEEDYTNRIVSVRGFEYRLSNQCLWTVTSKNVNFLVHLKRNVVRWAYIVTGSVTFLSVKATRFVVQNLTKPDLLLLRISFKYTHEKWIHYRAGIITFENNTVHKAALYAPWINIHRLSVHPGLLLWQKWQEKTL